MNPKLLQNLCIYEIINAATINDILLDRLRSYPFQLRNMILYKASQRMQLLQNVNLLSALLNSKVEHLNLINCTLNNDMLKTLCVCCELKELLMNGNKDISKEVLQEVIPFLPKLEIFINRDCPNLDNDVIKLLVKSCPRIHTLDISKCGMTAETFPCLGNFRLKSLSITGVQFQLSDEDIDALLTNCTESLEELHITTCSDRASQKIIDECKRLRTFNIAGTMKHGPYFAPGRMLQLNWIV